MITSPRRAGRAEVRSTPVRIAGWAASAGLLLVVVADALRQRDVPGLIALGALASAALLVAGVVAHSSSGLALGVVATAMSWALAQDAETASGAVLVGAALSTGVIVVGRLRAPGVVAPIGPRVRSAVRLLAAVGACVAVGLVVLRLVERQPVGVLGALAGIGAVGGLLAVLVVVGGAPRPTSARTGGTGS